MDKTGRSPKAGTLALIATLTVMLGLSGALYLSKGHFARGLFLLAAGALVFQLLRVPHSALEGAPDPFFGWALVPVFAAGVFFRLYRLTPPGLWGDDAINGLLAFDILDGRLDSPFQLVRHAHSYFHALTNFFIATSFALLGPSPTSLRVPGVVAGILTIPLFHGIVAPLFGRRTAWIATLFFATSALQLNHNKVLLQVIFSEFFLLLGMCALIHGLSYSRRSLVSIAGMFFAGCLYVYHSARIAPLIPVVFVAAILRNREQRRSLPGARPRWLIECAVMFLICSGPLLWSLFHSEARVLKRIDDVAIWHAVATSGSLVPLRDSLVKTLGAFHYQQGPVTLHWFGIGSDPALNLIVGGLVLAGLLLSLRRVHEPRHLLLVVWFVTGLLPGILSTEAPRIYRVFLASPPIFVWAAFPLALCLTAASGSRRHWPVTALVAAVIGAVPLIDFDYYFRRVYSHPGFRYMHAEPMVQLAENLRDRGPGWVGRLLSSSFSANYETLRFLSRAWNLQLVDVTRLSDELPVRNRSHTGTLFIMVGDTAILSELLTLFYPQVAAEQISAPTQPSSVLEYWLQRGPGSLWPASVVTFAVSREEEDRLQGLQLTVIGKDGRTLRRKRVPLPGLPLPGWSDDLRDQIKSIRWSGSIYVPVTGEYSFRIPQRSNIRFQIDDQQVVTEYQAAGTLWLEKGLHLIVIETSNPDTFELRWKRPGRVYEPIHPAALFRFEQRIGLRATQHRDSGRVETIELYPFFDFFRFPPYIPYELILEGKVTLPERNALRVESNAAVSLQINRRTVLGHRSEVLPRGEYDIVVRIRAERAPLRFVLFAQSGVGTQRSVPPTWFTPVGARRESTPKMT